MNVKMTWEETIIYIRTLPEYKQLIQQAYLEEDLLLNIERFNKSEEWIETLKLIGYYQPKAQKVLDVGSGNGISAINFAREAYQVTALEPDPSTTVGIGAIEWLKKYYELNNLDTYLSTAEQLNLPSNTFDIIYARQSMHHANDLENFLRSCAKVLKKGGLFISIRDHVVFNENDKKKFLHNHPLQKYYQGENAFHPQQYKQAMMKAGLEVIKQIKYWESPINYFPITSQQIQELKKSRILHLRKKLNKLANFPFIVKLYNFYADQRFGKLFDESNIPGRMYSYIALKR